MTEPFKPVAALNRLAKRGNRKGRFCKCGSYHPLDAAFCPRWKTKIMTTKKYVIGIDPDSKAHGVAVYEFGTLTVLKCMDLIELQGYLIALLVDAPDFSIEVHIEDVSANNAVFRRGDNLRDSMSIARRLGMVQQSQTELERMIKALGIRIIHHAISKTWKKNKAQFEKVTGWEGRSNEDGRSAAYFGYLGCK